MYRIRKSDNSMAYECKVYDKNGKLKKFPAQINDLKSYKLVIESDEIFVDA